LHSKADSTYLEDKITHSHIYFATELADKFGTNSESDSFSKPYLEMEYYQ